MSQSRFYSANAQPTVLTAGITPTTTVINVQQTVGFPATTPFILALDYNSPSEEIVLATAVAGTNITVTRAYDGTSATSHNAGAAVRHTWTAMDGNDSRAHEGSISGVHGVTGNVVGTTDTQTLSNKTLTSPTINSGTLNNSTFTGTTNLASPNITGTVTGGASYSSITATTPSITSPSITGTVSGGATYSAHQDNDLTVRNSAVGTVPLTVNSIASTTANLADVQFNGTSRLNVSAVGRTTMAPSNTATKGALVNAATGFVGNLLEGQLNAVSKFSVTEAGNTTYLGSLTGGSAGQFTVDSSGNLTAAGNISSMGAWTSFTPTWTTSGTAPTLGNGTLVSRYMKIGRLVHWIGALTIGTTTNPGTGIWSFSLPFTSANNGIITQGTANYMNPGDNEYVGVIDLGPNATTMQPVVKTQTSYFFSNVSNTVPVATGSTDSLQWSVTYEASS
jgi:hypothetical protein